HMLKGSAADPLQRLCFKFSFDIDNRPYGGYSEDEAKRFIYFLSSIRFFNSKNLSRIRPQIEAIQSELLRRNLGYYSNIQHLFSLLFIAVIREYAAASEQKFNVTATQPNKASRINIIDNFFDLNYYYKATPQDLCQLIQISKSQLNRILKAKYNMTFKQKHMEAQIEHIKDMLVNTDLPIGSISERIGYTAECSFTTFFKHATGLSPKQYRKQFKNAAT
ncbi:MAG TPA: hypothetical protein DD640_07955, partial [Clostridiales bacterium]|nr:hypothetical protein [Clostridiales bacterium]